MAQSPLGDLQLDVLNFLAEHGPLTVGEAAARFGEPRGLARTTILTVMERLREKGYATRTKQGGVFQYSACSGKPELQRGLVREFVERALDGSVSPFFAYLAQEKELTDEEIAALQRLLEAAAREKKEPGR